MNVEINGMYVPRCGIAGSYCISRFTFLRNCQMISQSDWSILQFYQQCVRVFCTSKGPFEIPAEKSATKSMGTNVKRWGFAVLGTCVCLVCRFRRKSTDGSFGSSDGKKNPGFNSNWCQVKDNIPSGTSVSLTSVISKSSVDSHPPWVV